MSLIAIEDNVLRADAKPLMMDAVFWEFSADTAKSARTVLIPSAADG